MAENAISAEDFIKFSEFFYRKTGISFEESKRYFVDKRLMERIAATSSTNFKAYFSMLRFQASGAETQILTNLMTVNETYFFREAYQFDCLVNSMLEEVVQYKQPGETIRIWSIPSSSGEEPYSIVIYLLEHWAKLNQYDVEILASDIDTAILETARRGIFTSRSVQNVSQELLKKYFRKLPGGNWQISDDIRDSVDFSRVNLIEAGDTRRFSRIDVIFCRNLLIYFDDISRQAAAKTFYQAMSPGAFICLGHSESMSRMSSLFSVRKFKDAIVYQKPLRGQA
ncbi:protein-glutamate O-methyltransferase CheR [Neorhizobium lilium]|uniref:Chemotaxis protein methyltransferase n=2 Tax=Neorhizobium lilium TaxID=2503024 RepID=A0A3S3SBJ5_9HYPH|nr:protein-glutamate O-methyltransferase CheR [Neorhizobium lilium]